MPDTAAPSAAGLRMAYRSDSGRVRTNNEDLPLIDPERGVYGVIDGVGGQAAGELAAAIAHDVILQRLARPLGTPAERVREAIAIANNEIFRRAGESPDLHGMTCVVTLAVISERTLTIGHVGDSRLYKLRAGTIRKLTSDHSPVGEREDAQQISEAEAMRHPRRHEVFRDVGGAQRDKDEENYVDVLHEPFEPDCAVLLCTDGLSDMVPSATIDHLVRRNAGNPEAVVDALVSAANEAGGRDNVTVVYVEGPDFARAAGNRRADLPPSMPARPDSTAPERPSGGRIRTLGRWITSSRTTWFALGAVTGVLGALLLVSRIPSTTAVANRTIVVGPDGADAFPRIADALRAAGAGDTVRIEPGIYPERLFVPNGVHLVARVPATVTLVRAAGSPGEWVAITAFGDLGGRISGLRVESTAALPVDVGIRVAGQSRTIELVELAGPMRAGVELLQGSALTLHGSHFAVDGPAMTAGQRAQATLTRNVFLRPGRPAIPPLTLGPLAQTTLRGNLFAGFGSEIVKGASPAERQLIAAANVIVTADPSRAR